MESIEQKKSKETKRKWPGWLLIAAFIVLLAAMAVGITFFRRANGEAVAVVPTPPAHDPLAEPTPSPTAEPFDTPEAAGPTEAAPSETPEPEADTPVPTEQSFAKTAIVVDGETVLVMSSRQAAEELLMNVLLYFEEKGEAPANAITELDCELELKDADEYAVTANYDGAFLYFTGDRTPLRVKTVASYVEDTVIPHKDTVIYDSKLPKGIRVTRLVGRDGIERKVYSMVYMNGVLQQQEVREVYTVIEPVNGDIRIGQRVFPENYVVKPTFGNDPQVAHSIRFSPPVNGKIITFYGPSSEGFHHGIDIAVPAGTEVKAAAYGKVVTVMERGSYGLIVEIQHENGVTTRYARMADVCVSIGDKVMTGDVIGSITDDDYVTHLHLELRVNGTAYNPLKVLSQKAIEG